MIENRWLHATFDPDTGNLCALTTRGGGWSAVREVYLRYHADGALYSERANEPGANAPQVVKVQRRPRSTTSVLRLPHLQFKRTFELLPDSPLLRVRYEWIGIVRAVLHGPGVLFIQLAEDVIDPATDEKDLYFDGAELGGGRELPCWRVVYCRGHRRGVMLATRSKRSMSRLMFDRQMLEIRPHVYAQQQVDNSLRDIPVQLAPRQRMVVEFELGCWSAPQHRAMLHATGLQRPVAVTPTPIARSRSPKRGHVLWLADAAGARITSRQFHPSRWLRVPLPWDKRRDGLLCNSGCRPPRFFVTPPISGPCRVFVGGSRFASLGLQFSGDPYPCYRYGVGGTAFHSALYGPDQQHELDFGVTDLTGQPIHIVPNTHGHWPARLDYLRFQPLSDRQARQWRRQQQRPAPLPISGIPDCGDVFFFLMDRHTLDPRIIQGNIWEQARAGFKRVYWQMHGSFTTFHTRIGTRLPMLCRGHGAFEPQMKAAVLFQRKHDLLRLAVETCRELGMECWGAARLNAYMSGKRDAFFTNHPHYAEINEAGTWSGNKICYAIPEVRRYHRSILVEAARYGLLGLLLGFLRHPPLLLYHPVLVGAFRQRYGKLPPRQPDRADPHHLASLPADDEQHRRWYSFRAEFMTQFVRELKHDLREQGLGHVKISAWVRANHCLFDGIDLEQWFKEGLCDEVIADIYSDANLDEPAPAWVKWVRAHVPLIRGIGFGTTMADAAGLRRMIAQPSDGLCAYGSEQFIQTQGSQALLEAMRGL